MIDERFKKKSTAITAIMNNTKLSKAVIDGLNAPIGSSKRSKAVAILGAFNKGDKQQSQVLDGKGGMPDNSSMMNPATGQLIPSVLPSEKLTPQGVLQQQSSGSSTALTSMVDPATGQLVYGSEAPKRKILLSTFPQEKPITEAQSSYPSTEKQFSVDETGQIVPYHPGLDIPKVMHGKTTEPKVETVNEDTYFGPQEAPDSYQAPPQEYDDSDLSEADKEFIKLANKYKTSGFSAQTAANLLMNNTALLRKIGISEELLPIHGASLVGQISDLAETLRQKTGLEMAENNLTNLQERGMTITDDLTAYIKGKDKYIKNINDMMDKSSAYRKTIDMSLPENQRSMKNYNNYLSILKGRQQQRYIDFLNTGITYHNAELKRATNSYNDTYKRFTSELSTQTAITKENYERLNNMLMDMYNNIVNREKIAGEKTLFKNKVLISEMEAAETVLDYTNKKLGISDSGWSQLTDNTQAQAKAQYVASNDGDKSDLEAEFNALPDADKLSWTTNKNKNNTEYVDYYVEKVLNDEIEGNLSDYYDDETGLPVYKNIPNNNNLRTQVEMEVDKIRPLLTTKNKETKGMTPKEKIRYYLGK